jgi:hypothetical protein
MLNADGCSHVGARGCRELGTEVGDEVDAQEEDSVRRGNANAAAGRCRRITDQRCSP